jgi:translation initiation factor 1
VVYSTDPDYSDPQDQIEEDLISPTDQRLKVWYEKRNGKPSTIVRDFEGPESELKELGRELKKSCSCGGSVKNGEIILQGDVRDKVMGILQNKGFQAKKAGG